MWRSCRVELFLLRLESFAYLITVCSDIWLIFWKKREKSSCNRSLATFFSSIQKIWWNKMECCFHKNTTDSIFRRIFHCRSPLNRWLIIHHTHNIEKCAIFPTDFVSRLQWQMHFSWNSSESETLYRVCLILLSSEKCHVARRRQNSIRRSPQYDFKARW